MSAPVWTTPQGLPPLGVQRHFHLRQRPSYFQKIRQILQNLLLLTVLTLLDVGVWRQSQQKSGRHMLNSGPLMPVVSHFPIWARWSGCSWDMRHENRTLHIRTFEGVIGPDTFGLRPPNDHHSNSTCSSNGPSQQCVFLILCSIYNKQILKFVIYQW